MRVAIVSGVPLTGAPEIGSAYYSRALGEALRATGVDVEIWAKDGALPYASANVPLLRTWRPGWSSWLDILGAVRRRKPSVVHLQHAMFVLGAGGAGEISAILLMLCLAIWRKPLVVTCHDIPRLRQITRQYVRLHKYTYPRIVVKAGLFALFWAMALCSRRILVHQAAFKETLISDFGLPSSKVTVVPHLPMPFERVEMTAAREKTGTPMGAQVLLFFGFATGYKGIDILLDAMDLLASRNHQAQLILGAGPHPKVCDKPDYIEYYQALQTRVAGMRNVRFAGFIADQELDSYIESCDAAIFPYVEFQGMSGPLTQCAAHSRPFLISSVMSRVIPGIAAGVFEPESGAIASTIERYFGDPAFAQEVRNECAAFESSVLGAEYMTITTRTYAEAAAGQR